LTGLRLVGAAALFATQKHRDQRRKDGVTPYIVHPLEVFVVLVWAGVRSAVVLAVALLHDTMEETQTTFPELSDRFGEEVASAVLALTDDKRLERADRKRLQIQGAARLPHAARPVRLADKIVNCDSMPPEWLRVRRAQYFEDSRKVREALRGTHARLEALFDRVYAERERVLSGGCFNLTALLLGIHR
jgi:guanosine-3',5'-bis(diphosphate) 3'-pyrophosphohydrolase